MCFYLTTLSFMERPHNYQLSVIVFVICFCSDCSFIGIASSSSMMAVIDVYVLSQPALMSRVDLPIIIVVFLLHIPHRK